MEKILIGQPITRFICEHWQYRCEHWQYRIDYAVLTPSGRIETGYVLESNLETANKKIREIAEKAVKGE